MESRHIWRFLVVLTLFAATGRAEPKAEQSYLTIDKAVVNFTTVQPGQQAVAALVVTVKPGLHAQAHIPTPPNLAMDLTLDNNPSIKPFDAIFPPGKLETIAGGQALVYTDTLTIYIPFEVNRDTAPGPLKITGIISYQACNADKCFFPTDQPFTIATTIQPAGQPGTPQNIDLFKDLDPALFSHLTTPSGTAAPAAPPAAETWKFLGIEVKHDSYLLAFIAAFVAGIIFNAVPCVLPVLPLKAIGFYEVSQHNRARSLAFGAVFSLGLIASFAVLAMFIVVYKAVGWGEVYSNVWFNLAIVIVLLAMAVGTFGVFTVNVPTSLYNITPRHDTYLGNFLFGILTAILSTPCTFGLFVAVLAWAITQPAAIGVALVMTVGAGMASPYFVLSAFPELARKFPRTGPWSELVKQMMSFLLLGSAIFFARRFIEPYSGTGKFWWTLFAVAVAGGLFLFFKSLQISVKATPRLVSGVLAALIIGGAFWIVHELANEPYKWTPYSAAELESARRDGRVVVIDFTAAWCSNCKYLEAFVLNSKPVIEEVRNRNVEMIKADLTSADAAGWPLLKQKGDVVAIPLTLVYGPGSAEPQKLNGIYTIDQLIHAIETARSGK